LEIGLETVLRVGLEVGSELEVAVAAKVLPARSKVADREIESHSVEARLGQSPLVNYAKADHWLVQDPRISPEIPHPQALTHRIEYFRAENFCDSTT